MITQDVVKMPSLGTYQTLTGETTTQLPDNAKITVQGYRELPYQVMITRKTKYNVHDLRDKKAKFTAVINTDKNPWEVYSINKVIEHKPVDMGELYELEGEY